MNSITEYDDAWPAQFAELAERVRTALGELAVTIEHVGSTSVPGLLAKPIIDLDVVTRAESMDDATRRLGEAGYAHEGDLGIPGREAFRCPPGAPAHHLYLLSEGAPELLRHLAFRDALRADSDLRDRYADLKRRLAAQHPNDRRAYGEGKSAFVTSVLRR